MSFKHPWPPAYTGLTRLPPDKVKRLTVEVPLGDTDEIIRVTLSPYILTTICQYAIRQTAEEIRNLKLSHAEQRAFIDHICKRTYREFVKEAGASDVPGRTESICNGVAEPSHTTTGSGKEVAEGSRGGRGGGGKTGGEKGGKGKVRG